MPQHGYFLDYRHVVVDVGRKARRRTAGEGYRQV